MDSFEPVKNMITQPRFILTPIARTACLLALATLLGGCDRNDATVVVVPKENPTPAAPVGTLPPGHPDTSMAMQPGMDMGMGMPNRPRISYKAPEGWTESAPGSVRVASFRIAKDSKQADVSVIPLAGAAGGDLANVNRWRGQVGLEPVTEAELKQSAEAVQIAGAPAELYELSGKNPGSGDAMRVLGAIQHRDGVAWFFKVSGDDALVAEQKPAVIEFLKSVKFEAPDASALPASHPPLDGMSMPSATAASAPAEGRPTWQVPSGWTETPGGQFLVAKFLLTGSGSAQAAVNVSASAGDGGGFANNVNRWRGQLGLAPQSESEINSQARTVDASGAKATFVELSGTDPRSSQPMRVLGAMVPQGGQTYFYKLSGDAALVESQRSAFETFVITAKY
jgi:hypothetical protein